jgi:hypothetical protein
LTSLNNFHQIHRHPDVDLLKAFFQPLYVFDEELSILCRIENINKNSDVQVSMNLTGVFLLAFERLRFG